MFFGRLLGCLCLLFVKEDTPTFPVQMWLKSSDLAHNAEAIV